MAPIEAQMLPILRTDSRRARRSGTRRVTRSPYVAKAIVKPSSTRRSPCPLAKDGSLVQGLCPKDFARAETNVIEEPATLFLQEDEVAKATDNIAPRADEMSLAHELNGAILYNLGRSREEEDRNADVCLADITNDRRSVEDCRADPTDDRQGEEACRGDDCNDSKADEQGELIRMSFEDHDAGVDAMLKSRLLVSSEKETRAYEPADSQAHEREELRRMSREDRAAVAASALLKRLVAAESTEVARSAEVIHSCKSFLSREDRAQAAAAALLLRLRKRDVYKSSRHVSFDLDATEERRIISYSEIYGEHPRRFVFGRNSERLPAAPPGFVGAQSSTVDEDSSDSDGDSSDSD